MLDQFCQQRRRDLTNDAAALEGIIPGISDAPTFPVRIANDAVPPALDILWRNEDAALGRFVPRNHLRDVLLPRAEAACEQRGKVMLYVTPDIGTSTGCERGEIITPFERSADARVLDVGANEQGAAHIAEAINSMPHGEFIALESTFL